MLLIICIKQHMNLKSLWKCPVKSETVQSMSVVQCWWWWFNLSKVRFYWTQPLFPTPHYLCTVLSLLLGVNYLFLRTQTLQSRSLSVSCKWQRFWGFKRTRVAKGTNSYLCQRAEKKPQWFKQWHEINSKTVMLQTIVVNGSRHTPEEFLISLVKHFASVMGYVEWVYAYVQQSPKSSPVVLLVWSQAH